LNELVTRPEGHRATLWVESSHHKEAARSLEMLHVQLISAVIDPYSWKWVVVAAHHAVQAFALAVIDAREAPGGERQAAQSRDGILKFESGPAHRLDPKRDDYLPPLYERAKTAVGYAPGPEIDAHVAALSEYRNVFVQGMALRWELYVADLPRMLQSCLVVVEHLGWNPGFIPWEKSHLTDLARVKCLASSKILEALDRQYRS
jgi:hypothetical protein